jgi:hypothetical protein
MSTKPYNKRTLNVAACLENEVDWYIPVHWRLDGADRQAVIYVNVPGSFNDRRVIAELCALNHLMNCGRPILGSSRAPASSLTTVTAGAIRKAHRAETEKGEIIPFARFLFSSFCEGALEVEKDIDWTSSLPVVEEMRIDAKPAKLEKLPLAALCDNVGITRHAVERYQERVGTVSVSNSISSLRRLMADLHTVAMPVSEYKRITGLGKYGKAAKFFIHRQSKTIFVVLPEWDGWVLATVYYEAPARKEAVYVGGRIEMRNR